ncbi:MAG: sorbosone dehydrogenase family protein, partial [Pseudomonadota bacterium]|nr:sorbosone dehydrogenase family protein [Pseudomonadota bacterium]
MRTPRTTAWLALAILSVCLAACTETARLSVRDGMGPDPKLPEPVQRLVPTVNVAEASGWPPGA